MTTEHKYTNTLPIAGMSDAELADTADYKFDQDNDSGVLNSRSKDNSDWGILAEQLRVRPDDDIPPDPVCLSILSSDGSSATFGTLGNISALIGKTKSRKTFAVAIATGAAIRQNAVLRMVGTFDEMNRNVLVFDTEQGRYHVHKVVGRICRLAGVSFPENLFVYGLRPLTTEQRLEFIKWMIYNTENVGLVVIDGIRDLVHDINDNTEATNRLDDLLRWTAERHIHILTVIHMNKGNDMIRGTLGTELQNKAETVVSISLDPENKEVSIIKPEYCRDKDFEPFAFSIDETGLPYIREDWQEGQRSASRKEKKAEDSNKSPKTITPNSFSKDVHYAILRRGFEGVEPDKYTSTIHRIMAAADYFGHKFGENKAKSFVTFYIDTTWLVKVGTKYVLNLPPPEIIDTSSEILV